MEEIRSKPIRENKGYEGTLAHYTRLQDRLIGLGWSDHTLFHVLRSVFTTQTPTKGAGGMEG